MSTYHVPTYCNVPMVWAVSPLHRADPLWRRVSFIRSHCALMLVQYMTPQLFVPQVPKLQPQQISYLDWLFMWLWPLFFASAGERLFFRFKVQDDRVGKDNLAAWACIRLDRLRMGVRFVHLWDANGIESHGQLLVHIDKRMYWCLPVREITGQLYPLLTLLVISVHFCVLSICDYCTE